jgi:hypothetical protein
LSDIVQKLWGFCHTLRHDGVDYGSYIDGHHDSMSVAQVFRRIKTVKVMAGKSIHDLSMISRRFNKVVMMQEVSSVASKQNNRFKLC